MAWCYQGMEPVDQGIPAIEHDGADFQDFGFQVAGTDLVHGKVDQFHIHDGFPAQGCFLSYCHFSILPWKAMA